MRGLTRRYGDLLALDGVSFEVGAGEVFGFIGPNGAGKTTTIRILATLLEPSAGRVVVGGHDVTREPERVRDLLGYMPDRWGVYPDLSVRDYLWFFAAAHGIPRRERAAAIQGALALTDLDGLAERDVEGLSKGMRQRLCLAQTLVHDPRLLILDEPADGLDPRARIELRELLKELARMGKTILISSHILTELSDLVTSVGIVERGRMLMTGALDAVLARLAGDSGAAGTERRLRYTLRTGPGQVGAALEVLRALPFVLDAGALSEQEVRFAYRGAEAQVAEAVRALGAARVDLLALVPERADLEQVFMAVTKGRVQ